MNKSELLDTVAGATACSKREVESVVDAFFETVKGAVKKGDQVSWPGFGSFKESRRGARTGRNPQTGAPVKIAASRGVKFTASSTLKEFLNAKRASPAKKSVGKKATAKSAAKSTKKR